MFLPSRCLKVHTAPTWVGFVAGINKAPLYQGSFFELPARLGTNAIISHLFSRPPFFSISCLSFEQTLFTNDVSFSLSLSILINNVETLLSSHCYERKFVELSFDVFLYRGWNKVRIILGGKFLILIFANSFITYPSIFG